MSIPFLFDHLCSLHFRVKPAIPIWLYPYLALFHFVFAAKFITHSNRSNIPSTMSLKQLLAQWSEFTASLRAERFVDDQFSQLKQLQDESSPNFVIEVVYLFFDDSQKLVDDMGRALEQNIVDFKQVDDHVHQLKGSSASIGAARVKSLCVAFREFCETKNLEMCLRCLQEVRCECVLLRSKLEYLFTLERNIVEAGGSVPMME